MEISLERRIGLPYGEKNPIVCVSAECGGGICYPLADPGKGNISNDSGLWDSFYMFWTLLRSSCFTDDSDGCVCHSAQI